MSIYGEDEDEVTYTGQPFLNENKTNNTSIQGFLLFSFGSEITLFEKPCYNPSLLSQQRFDGWLHG